MNSRVESTPELAIRAATGAAAAWQAGFDSRSASAGTFVAERGWEDYAGPSCVRTHAQSHAEIESPHARVPLYGWMRYSSCDTAAHRCALVDSIDAPSPLTVLTDSQSDASNAETHKGTSAR